MKSRRLRQYLLPSALLSATLVFACSQASKPVPVSRAQFANMSWLVGAWRGSGGQYSAFYEEYRLLNDSTILQRNYKDSTFTVASDSATIEWRAGTVANSSGGTVKYVLTNVTADTLRFAQKTGRGGFTWVRVAATSWTAILDAPVSGGNATVYRMERVRP